MRRRGGYGLGRILSIYIRWIFTFMICVLIGAAPTRKSSMDIPGAPFKDGCRILLNELALSSSEPFIELARYCEEEFASIPQKIDIGRYAIVIVDTAGFIIGSCMLDGRVKTDGLWYYLISSDVYTKMNFDIEECDLASPFYQNGRINFLDTTPVAVMLIKNERPSVLKKFKLLNVGMEIVRKFVTPELTKIIVSNLQDMNVIGLETSDDVIEEFKKYYTPTQESPFHTVRISKFQSNTRSINRCARRSDLEKYFMPFQASKMKISRFSPGKTNECSPDISEEPPRKRCRMLPPPSEEEEFGSSEEEPLVPVASFNRDADDECNQAQAGSSRNNFNIQSREQQGQPLGNVQVTADAPAGINDDVSEFPYDLNEKTTDQFEQMIANIPELFWDDCDSFSKAKITLIQSKMNQPVDIQLIINPPVCTWIDYILPTGKFICKKCHLLLNQKILIDRPGSPLLTKLMRSGDGKLDVQESETAHARFYNKNMILNHEKNILHEISMNFFELFRDGKRGDELQELFEKEGGLYRNYFKASENVVASVIQNVKMNTPFRSYRIFGETMDYFGVPLGHLYRTPAGFRMISDLIGRRLHKDVIEYLLLHRPEISITLDTTTDVAGYAVMGICFQTLDEDNRVKTILYRVVHIPKGERGTKLFEAFMEAITEDGLVDYLKEKLVGLSTDGHPAVRRVFRRLLNEFMDNELVGVWCGAHLLELAATKAFETFEYLVQVDSIINRMFRLLTAKSPTRREEFRSQIPRFGVRLFGIPKVRRLRWLMHHVRALSPYIFRYGVLVETLENLSKARITIDRKEKFKYNIKTRTEARDLLLWLKDPTFLLTIAFTADVLQILAELSLEYQRQGSTLIGKKWKRDQLLQKLSALQTTHGRHFSYVVENANILAGDPQNDPIKKLESCKFQFDGVVLNDPDYFDSGHTISEKMEEYIDEILTQVLEYYPEDTMDNFDVLIPSKLPQSFESPQSQTYGTQELKNLNVGFKWGYDETNLLEDWRNLCLSLSLHPEFQQQRKNNAEEFWSYFLQAEFVEWTHITREIVRKALTVPASSSQPERIFSMYAFVKTRARYSLLPPTVENLIRIKFNGPEELRSWNLLKFAREIPLNGHSRPDDTSRRQTWKKVHPELDVYDTFEISDIEGFGIVDEDGLETLMTDAHRDQVGNEDIDGIEVPVDQGGFGY